MNHIKTFESFEYEPINEGLLGDLKATLINWWNNIPFKKKIVLAKQIMRLINQSRIGILIGLAIELITGFIPGLKMENSTTILINCTLILIQLSSFLVENKLRKFRKNIIAQKIAELKRTYDPDTWHGIYFVIGKERNVKLAIDRLKADGILTDDSILVTDDVTIIDTTDSFIEMNNIENDNINPVIDPFNEEEWDEETANRRPDEITKIKSMMRTIPLLTISGAYDVRFRNITDTIDATDRFEPFYFKKNDISYKNSVDVYRDRERILNRNH